MAASASIATQIDIGMNSFLNCSIVQPLTNLSHRLWVTTNCRTRQFNDSNVQQPDFLSICHGALHQSRKVLAIIRPLRLGWNRMLIGEISGPVRADYA